MVSSASLIAEASAVLVCLAESMVVVALSSVDRVPPSCCWTVSNWLMVSFRLLTTSLCAVCRLSVVLPAAAFTCFATASATLDTNVALICSSMVVARRIGDFRGDGVHFFVDIVRD